MPTENLGLKTGGLTQESLCGIIGVYQKVKKP